MKKLFLLTIILILQACATAKNPNDQWIGQSKKNLIKAWGPPIRTLNHPNHGEILIYADQVYANTDTSEATRIAGPNYWNYTYIYTHKDGKIYLYKTDKQQQPPQTIAVK
ncbi:hypothetical protein [Flavobacterium lipolyticum]|uniref:Lipoprotein n=1 Tax=Flavobacterium lipolyticum TaxID=2893754 RepID=A0ABS8M2H8_9FLAO|nr:hypothetical protein [Flavobacterium sp. F-126]MCC9019034.1 hypothetical protein [Flavobacterium sp. F-126]